MPEIGANSQTGSHDKRIALICFFLIIAIVIADFAFPLGVAIDVLYVLVVLISFWSTRKTLIIAVSVICATLTVGAAFFQPAVPEMWKVIFNRGLGLFAILTTTFLGLKRKHAEEKREKALKEKELALEETRILRGLLPICSSCKKIRDDQGNWVPIEVFISKNSEANFTHGICEECGRKLYPGHFK
jgi:hypothetical protein